MGFSATTDTWGFILFYFLKRWSLVLSSHVVEEGFELLTLLSPLECWASSHSSPHPLCPVTESVPSPLYYFSLLLLFLLPPPPFLYLLLSPYLLPIIFFVAFFICFFRDKISWIFALSSPTFPKPGLIYTELDQIQDFMYARQAVCHLWSQYLRAPGRRINRSWRPAGAI